MAKIAVPKQHTFDLPEGYYKAKLVKHYQQNKQSLKGPQTFIRFIFQAEVPGMNNVTALAGRNFEANLNAGSDLYNFLLPWLGREFFLDLSGQELDFDCLNEKACEVSLRHFQGADFEKPLVVVDGVFPTGTLKLTKEPATTRKGRD